MMLILAIEDDGKSAMRIFSARYSDTTSWYKLWEAATALYYACVNEGKGGSFSGLGRLRNAASTEVKAWLIQHRRCTKSIASTERPSEIDDEPVYLDYGTSGKRFQTFRLQHCRSLLVDWR